MRKGQSFIHGINIVLPFLVTFYDQGIVLQALLITFGVFLALTVFTLQSKWDFSGMAPMYVCKQFQKEVERER